RARLSRFDRDVIDGADAQAWFAKLDAVGTRLHARQNKVAAFPAERTRDFSFTLLQDDRDAGRGTLLDLHLSFDRSGALVLSSAGNRHERKQQDAESRSN